MIKNFLFASFFLVLEAYTFAQDNTSVAWTFASGDSMSSRIDLDGKRLGGIDWGAAFSGTQVVVYSSKDTLRSGAKPVYYEKATTPVAVPFLANSIIGFTITAAYLTYHHVWLKSLNGSTTQTQAAGRSGRAILTEF